MKTKQKMLKLMEYGLKPKTLSDLSESQINSLYLRLLETKEENKEVVTKTSTTKTFDPSNDADRKALEDTLGQKGVPTSVDPATKKVTVVSEEGEIDEKFESKKQQKYFYSKCGDGKTKEQKKWCKMAKEFSSKTDFKKLPEKKKETKEGSNYQNIVKNTAAQLYKNNLGKTLSPQFESKLEKQITKLLEDNMNPKMSKRDFIKLIFEMDSPGTKEKEPITKPKPVTEPMPDIDYDPFNDPDPNDDPEANQKGLSIFMKQVMNKGMLK